MLLYLITIHNIRNFKYRTSDDFTPTYYDATYDLDQLQSTDLVCSYWAGPSVAHVFVSFGFADGRYVSFSIERRREVGEGSSTLRGFFRKYELIYIVADERDLIRVRTIYREPREKMYIYRTRLPVEHQLELFLGYVGEVNALAETPGWYNTLIYNCTTGVLARTQAAYHGRARYNWKLLLTGYAPRYAYEIGMLDLSMPFEELQRRSLVNQVAQEADQAKDFSQRIRQGLPMPQPYSLSEFESGIRR
jgi:hypothetical protein